MAVTVAGPIGRGEAHAPGAQWRQDFIRAEDAGPDRHGIKADYTPHWLPARFLAVPAKPAYSELVESGLASVLREVDRFLMGESKVQRTLERLSRVLDELKIDFALAGGLAVGVRGHLRVTVDVDVLVTAEGLARFKSRWLGRGYVEQHAGSRSVRDTETGVPIDFLVAGEFPGDGRPKSVAFPDPASVPRTDEPYRVLDLRTLVELKLAAGLSAADRLQDLADVIALVRANSLSASFAESLDASVRDKDQELWNAAQQRHDE